MKWATHLQLSPRWAPQGKQVLPHLGTKAVDSPRGQERGTAGPSVLQSPGVSGSRRCSPHLLTPPPRILPPAGQSEARYSTPAVTQLARRVPLVWKYADGEGGDWWPPGPWRGPRASAPAFSELTCWMGLSGDIWLISGFGDWVPQGENQFKGQ